MAQVSDVMLIDDDSLFTDIIGNHLKRDGIECVYAPTGAVAFDLLKKDPLPHVILLDVTMPDMDGFAVLEKLKQDARTKAIPVVMFSNDATPENIEHAKLLGAVRFVEKVQMTPGDVAALVHELIKK
jgi:CheY-like chemotaxis protein